MKIVLYTLGLVLIVLGAASFAYQGIDYTSKKDVAEIKIPEIGHLQLTETKKQRIEIPPVVAGGSILVGLILLGIGFRVRK